MKSGDKVRYRSRECVVVGVAKNSCGLRFSNGVVVNVSRASVSPVTKPSPVSKPAPLPAEKISPPVTSEPPRASSSEPSLPKRKTKTQPKKD